jgi:hypothetical protein
MNNDLIARLEAATEGSRELDIAVGRAAGEEVDLERDQHGRPLFRLARDAWGILPHYTTSLDAALTLVPEGHLHWYVGRWPIGYRAEICRHHQTPPHIPMIGATPALALCIAALRARGEKP